MAAIGSSDRQLASSGAAFERVCGRLGYRIVSHVVAAVLVAAAFLKLLDGPSPLAVLLASGEAVLGIWLLTGRFDSFHGGA